MRYSKTVLIRGVFSTKRVSDVNAIPVWQVRLGTCTSTAFGL